MRTSLTSLILMALVLAGCTGGGSAAKTEAPKTDAPKTSVAGEPTLKELIKEDVTIGKAPAILPKMKPVAVGDVVFVEYTGTYKDGKVFDSNDPKTEKGKGRDVFPFQVGNGEVIKGWDEGLIGMLPGGVRKLSVPWEKAYGEAGRGEIPPKADLYFTVKVLDVIKAGEASIFDTRDIKVGSGAPVTAGKKVMIDYVVRTVRGDVVEDRKDVTFTTGKEEVLAGFEEGIMGMRVGGVRELRLPPAIGFRTLQSTTEEEEERSERGPGATPQPSYSTITVKSVR